LALWLWVKVTGDKLCCIFFFFFFFFFKVTLVFFFFLRFIYLFIIYVHCSCLQTLQKRASDLVTDDCEPPCGCWDLNSEPLEEQSGALTH
jgi:predicted membrane protein